MGKYTERALKVLKLRREKANQAAVTAFDNAISSDALLTQINIKIRENSVKLISLFGINGSESESVKKNIDSLNKDLYSRMDLLKIDTSSFVPRYNCKKCEDKGFFRGKKCDCLKALEMEFALNELNESLPIDTTGFDSFKISLYPEECREQMEDILDFCKAYAMSFNSKSGSILMTGNTGLGKTHLSLSIVKEAIKKGYNCAYGSAQNFLTKIENEHFSRGDERTDTLDALITADLLIFDDLGTEFSSPYINSTIYSIINTRLLSQKPTIISTNLSLEELKHRYGDRIVSRIMGSYDILCFEGRDIRVLKRMQELKG